MINNFPAGCVSGTYKFFENLYTHKGKLITQHTLNTCLFVILQSRCHYHLEEWAPMLIGLGAKLTVDQLDDSLENAARNICSFQKPIKQELTRIKYLFDLELKLTGKELASYIVDFQLIPADFLGMSDLIKFFYDQSKHLETSQLDNDIRKVLQYSHDKVGEIISVLIKMGGTININELEVAITTAKNENDNKLVKKLQQFLPQGNTEK